MGWNKQSAGQLVVLALVSSLIIGLLSLSFYATAILPLANVTAKVPVVEMSMPTVSLCAIAKDEMPYVDEWMDYNLALGFTEVFLYDNNVVPGALEQWKQQTRFGDVRINVIPIEGRARQIPAYNDCAHLSRLRNHTWAAFWDVDEFLILRSHDNVVSLLQHHLQGGALGLNWFMFGQNGQKSYRPEPVTRRFTERTEVNQHVKSVVHLRDLQEMVNPHYPRVTGGQHDTNNHSFAGPFNPNGPTDVAVIHHYWTKSVDEFRVKACVRGRADADDYAACNMNGTIGDIFDNTGWLELKKRVPWYSVFDDRASQLQQQAATAAASVPVYYR